MSEERQSRRRFLGDLVKYGFCAAGGWTILNSTPWLGWLLNSESGSVRAGENLQTLIRNAPRARFWVSTAQDANCSHCHEDFGQGPQPAHEHSEVIIRCQLCAQGCLIREGERGKCQARIHVDGELRTLVYGRPITVHIDPIEKKPFYHFMPGSAAFSLATSGCSLHCRFCQNWEISQAKPEDYDSPIMPPAAIVNSAVKNNAPIVAFTYNEPTVFTEYLTDIARAGKMQDLRSVLISCGFMQEAPLREMCGVLDAIKIDLKGFSESFYRDVCDAELKPVLRSIKQIADSGTHLEIVNLVVPTLNDSEKMLRKLADWVVSEVGPDVPVHYTRFHPDYQLMNLPPTPVATLELARQIGLDAGMHYAYVGNVPGHAGNHTYCPGCGRIVIQRSSFFITGMHVKNGACEFCGEKIAGVWS